MGILKHKDVFGSKWITAIVTTADDRIFFVPIKKTIGDYFLVKINHDIYVFTLLGARILTHRELFAKYMRVIIYDTSHFASTKAYHKKLEMVLNEEGLPKCNRLLLQLFGIIGKREKAMQGKLLNSAREMLVSKKDEDNLESKDIQVHTHVCPNCGHEEFEDNHPERQALIPKAGDLEAIYNVLSERYQDNPEHAGPLLHFIQELDRKHIVTPMRALAENLQDDLMTTRPAFFGELVPKLQRMYGALGMITNKPVTSKISWLKIFAVLGGIGMIAAFGYFAMEGGYLDGIIGQFTGLQNSFSGFQGIQQTGGGGAATAGGGNADYCSAPEIQKRWPEPVDLKAAMEDGREFCTVLPPALQEVIDKIP